MSFYSKKKYWTKTLKNRLGFHGQNSISLLKRAIRNSPFHNETKLSSETFLSIETTSDNYKMYKWNSENNENVENYGKCPIDPCLIMV